MWPRRAWLIAVFWVLREIELANIRLRDVDIAHGQATLTFPISKTDQTGNWLQTDDSVLLRPRAVSRWPHAWPQGLCSMHSAKTLAAPVPTRSLAR